MILAVVDDFAVDRGWVPVDDRVMGGISASRLRIEGAGRGLFTGTVSLEHGGGFASDRRPVTDGLPATTRALRLTLCGDGKAYRVTLGETPGVSAEVFQFDFTTAAGEAAVVDAPLAAFEHRFRGRPVGDGRSVAPEHVRSLGLVIGARQAGAFRLELARIDAVD